MPTRRFDRSQVYLVPPSLDDWLPADHPARFVADLIDAWDAATWTALGVERTAAAHGAPRYAPEVLLALWIYGFMDGRRSSRAIERECRTDLAYRWLSGNQQPDHNTLARFYQTHRETMRALFRQTVRIAVTSGLVEWAVQAVDSTKILANAAPDRSLTAAQLATLMQETEQAIADLEDQQTSDDEGGPPALPPALVDARQRRERIRAAQAALAAEARATKHNLTDPDAQIMKTRRGKLPAYNAQAVVARVAASLPAAGGRLIVATDLTTSPTDQGQLPAMVDGLMETTGRVADVLVADTGYHDAASLVGCAERGVPIVMPEPDRASPAATSGRFPQARFAYDPDTDTFTCPAGQALTYRGATPTGRGSTERRYRAPVAQCRGCPLRQQCLGRSEESRLLRVPSGIAAMRAHRRWMATEEAQALSAQRSRLIEPVFGTLKEGFGARRFLRRGLANVQSEWALTAAAFNLRTLWRCWRLGLVSP
jgi:transposase